MSIVRKFLLAAAFVAVPTAVALAATSTSGDCCAPKNACCENSAPCCDKSGAKQIVCPINGQTINEDECPLCKSAK